MPKSESVSVEILENLLAAYSSERNATTRYIAFSVQADKEGYLGVGSLFRAVAHSEQIHATNHARVLRKFESDLDVQVQHLDVESTSDNLQRAMQGEQDESEQMYPAFAEHARAERCTDALETFRMARDVEAEHALMFSAALESLEDYRDRTTYYVCATCGWVSAGANFRQCVFCDTRKNRFDRVD